MEANPKQNSEGPPYILIDTCVVQDAGSSNKDCHKKVADYLNSLNKRFRLAISEITVFENLHGLWGNKATKAVSILRGFEWKEVSTNVLTLSSIMGGLYKEESNSLSSCSVPDKIIASTAILLKGFVLTRNHSDFPAPFFIQDEWAPISFRKSHYIQTYDLGLYKPNYTLIGRRIKQNENR